MVARSPTPSVAEEKQPLRSTGQQLPAELGSDAASRAGHQDSLAPQVGEALLQIDLDRVPGQQILGIDLSSLDQVGLPVENL